MEERVSQEYPNHVCDCDDEDLSQACNPVPSLNGCWVEITCGRGHRRAVSSSAWAIEFTRRRTSLQSRKKGPHAETSVDHPRQSHLRPGRDD